MVRKLLLLMLAVWASGPTILMMDVHAAPASMPQIVNGGGKIDAVDPRDGKVIIDDGVLLLLPTTRVIDATGRPSNIQVLRHGTMVNYSATRDSKTAMPKLTEIVVLPSGQKPRRDED